MRVLGTEQYAFEAAAPDIWPWEQPGGPGRAPDETRAAEEPVQFDDVYPWLEPEA
jgi:hypothetical protein